MQVSAKPSQGFYLINSLGSTKTPIQLPGSEAWSKGRSYLVVISFFISGNKILRLVNPFSASSFENSDFLILCFINSNLCVSVRFI